MTEHRFKSLWPVFRNGLTWAAAWTMIGGALVFAVRLFNPRPGLESLPERVGAAFFTAAGMGLRFGIAGAVIGTVFSGVVRLGYRGRRLSEISPLRFHSWARSPGAGSAALPADDEPAVRRRGGGVAPGDGRRGMGHSLRRRGRRRVHPAGPPGRRAPPRAPPSPAGGEQRPGPAVGPASAGDSRFLSKEWKGTGRLRVPPELALAPRPGTHIFRP